MARLREIKKWGNSFTVILTSTDVKDLNINEGDMIDVEDIVIKKKGNKK